MFGREATFRTYILRPNLMRTHLPIGSKVKTGAKKQ